MQIPVRKHTWSSSPWVGIKSVVISWRKTFLHLTIDLWLNILNVVIVWQKFSNISFTGHVDWPRPSLSLCLWDIFHSTFLVENVKMLYCWFLDLFNSLHFSCAPLSIPLFWRASTSDTQSLNCLSSILVWLFFPLASFRTSKQEMLLVRRMTRNFTVSDCDFIIGKCLTWSKKWHEIQLIKISLLINWFCLLCGLAHGIDTVLK